MSSKKHRASVEPVVTNRAAIVEAHTRIAPHVRQTPVLHLTARELGAASAVACKLECLQHTGSFKPRGAFNKLLRVGPKTAGVIAASGGNHGAAVAYAAQALSLRAEIFVPESTPAAKVARIESYGARVFRHGATYAESLMACHARQVETGAVDVHAYDDPYVLAGQGTVARELERDEPELTEILVAVGGGGLIGGIAAWYAGSVRVIGVEPESCPTLYRALGAGWPVPAPVGGLAADSLGAREVGALMFPIAARYVLQAILVPDSAICDAQRWLWDRARILAEPGGATALAALLSGAYVPPNGARVGVVVCGGNTDPAKIAA